jgi:hypothetical protein
VDVLGPYPLQHHVTVEGCARSGLHPNSRSVRLIGQPSDLGNLCRTLRVDEVDALTVQDQCRESARGVSDLADPSLESIGRGEEEVAVA